jgi:hypothetical protein
MLLATKHFCNVASMLYRRRCCSEHPTLHGGRVKQNHFYFRNGTRTRGIWLEKSFKLMVKRISGAESSPKR